MKDKTVTSRAGPQLARSTLITAHDLMPTLDNIRPFTMVPVESLIDLGQLVQAVLTYDIPGHFVECGVWRGGSMTAAAMTLLTAHDLSRTLYLFERSRA